MNIIEESSPTKKDSDIPLFVISLKLSVKAEFKLKA
jgi:hypothetical protein